MRGKIIFGDRLLNWGVIYVEIEWVEMDMARFFTENGKREFE